MPETVDTPVATPAAAPDSPTAVLEQMDGMLAAFDTPAAPPSDKPPVDKPEKPPADPKAKPEAGKPDAPPAKPGDKPPEKPAPVSGPAQLRKRLEQIEEEFKGYKQTASNEQEKLKRQIAEYDKRKYLTPQEQERLDAIEKRSQALEAELYSRDYRESPEFAEKYQKRWDSSYKAAVQRVTGLSVESEDAESGEKNSRRVTQADFDKVRLSPPEEQFQLAEKLFGKYAYVVLQDVNALRGIEDAANDDIQTRSKTYHTRRQELYRALEKQSEEYQSAHQEIDRQLLEKYPGFFGEDKENPEVTAALQNGLKTVDDALAAADSLTPAVRAAKAAVIRRWAAAFPASILKIKRLEARLKEKDDELSKYRASDPGSGGEGGGGAANGKGDDDVPDVADLAKRFDK